MHFTEAGKKSVMNIDKNVQSIKSRPMSSYGLDDMFVYWLVGCLLKRPSNMRVYLRDGSCTDNFTCCHTEMEAADPIFHLTQSQYTYTGPTSPSADPITPAPGRVATVSANF